MPLYAITRVEPISAPAVLNTYNKAEENSPFFHNFKGKPKQKQMTPNKSKYNKHNQIVLMETSVQNNLGHNLNIYL